MIKGVQVVGAAHEGVVRAYCSHWVSQVAFEEPIVMASVSPKHDTHPLLVASEVFAISVLGADQVDIGQYFSYPGRALPPDRHRVPGGLGRPARGTQRPVLAPLRDLRAQTDGRPRPVLRPGDEHVAGPPG
jgi:flavin reductase (DIM6/NTAB) family NADH-FMN oxidoreductase RutF